jgi:hypothetical protein
VYSVSNVNRDLRYNFKPTCVTAQVDRQMGSVLSSETAMSIV